MKPVVLITGASSGIGKATAKLFYKQGYNLVLSSRSEESLKQVTNNFSRERYQLVTGDIQEEATAKQLVAQTRKHFGRLDVLVNNAGVGVFGSVEETSARDFDVQMRTNVRGVFLLTKHALTLLKEQDEGQIVMVSSMAAKNFVPDASVYCASKWALRGFTGSLKHELRDTHIKVGSILPGSVDTPFFAKAGAQLNPERHLSPVSVAQAIFQLATQPVDADVDEVVLRPARK